MMDVCTHLLRGMTGFERLHAMLPFPITDKYSIAAVDDIAAYFRKMLDELSSFEGQATATGGTGVSATAIVELDNEKCRKLFHSCNLKGPVLKKRIMRRLICSLPEYMYTSMDEINKPHQYLQTPRRS